MPFDRRLRRKNVLRRRMVRKPCRGEEGGMERKEEREVERWVVKDEVVLVWG